MYTIICDDYVCKKSLFYQEDILYIGQLIYLFLSTNGTLTGALVGLCLEKIRYRFHEYSFSTPSSTSHDLLCWFSKNELKLENNMKNCDAVGCPPFCGWTVGH